MSNPIQENLASRRLGSLDGILFRGPVQKHVQFGYFCDPPSIHFTVELDRESHAHSLAPGQPGRECDNPSSHVLNLA